MGWSGVGYTYCLSPPPDNGDQYNQYIIYVVKWFTYSSMCNGYCDQHCCCCCYGKCSHHTNANPCNFTCSRVLQPLKLKLFLSLPHSRALRAPPSDLSSVVVGKTTYIKETRNHAPILMSLMTAVKVHVCTNYRSKISVVYGP